MNFCYLAFCIINGLIIEPTSVMPAKAGIQNVLNLLDSGFHRNDRKLIIIGFSKFSSQQSRHL